MTTTVGSNWRGRGRSVISLSHASRPVKDLGALYTLEMRKVVLLSVIEQVARPREFEDMGLRVVVRSFRTYRQALGLPSSVSEFGVGLISVQLVWLDGR